MISKGRKIADGYGSSMLITSIEGSVVSGHSSEINRITEGCRQPTQPLPAVVSVKLYMTSLYDLRRARPIMWSLSPETPLFGPKSVANDAPFVVHKDREGGSVV